MKFSWVTILQGVEFSIFPIDFEWALQQCSAIALPVMGDRLRVANPHRCTTRPTQPPIFCGTGNEYRPKCGDALRLGVKAGWLIPFLDKPVDGR